MEHKPIKAIGPVFYILCWLLPLLALIPGLDVTPWKLCVTNLILGFVGTFFSEIDSPKRWISFYIISIVLFGVATTFLALSFADIFQIPALIKNFMYAYGGAGMSIVLAVWAEEKLR